MITRVVKKEVKKKVRKLRGYSDSDTDDDEFEDDLVSDGTRDPIFSRPEILSGVKMKGNVQMER